MLIFTEKRVTLLIFYVRPRKVKEPYVRKSHPGIDYSNKNGLIGLHLNKRIMSLANLTAITSMIVLVEKIANNHIMTV